MDGPLVLPWESAWWRDLVQLAEKNGSGAPEIIDLVQRQHAFGLEVSPDGHLVLICADDDTFVIWLAVGRNARDWIGLAEAEAMLIAARVGVAKLRIEDGRRGWRRLLPHWTVVGDDLELKL